MAENRLGAIKKDLEGKIGCRVRLTVHQGRQKTVQREGWLEKTYPHLFIVRLDPGKSPVQRVSYTYADVLTRSVELSLLGTGEGDAYTAWN